MEIKISKYQTLEITRNGPDCVLVISDYIESMEVITSLEKLRDLAMDLLNWSNEEISRV